MVDEQLIPRFVQSFYAAQAAVQLGDRQKGLTAYSDLLAQYKVIAASKLEKPHKDLAHQQVQSIYADLARLATSPTPRSEVVEPGFFGSFGARDYVTIGFFAVLIMLVLFFKPEYIGLSTYEEINQPPQWIGAETLYATPANVPLAIDLAGQFRDADGNALTYLATSAPDVSVSVKDSVVTVSSAAVGDHRITVMASDSGSLTKVPLTIRVV
jgi:hypothetical protein